MKTGTNELASARQAKCTFCLYGKVVGVETPQGKVSTSRVVLAAGAWSKQLGESLLHWLLLNMQKDKHAGHM